jgi:hypothetical protein
MTTPAQPDIRWQQRFQNFDRAFKLFQSALQLTAQVQS